MLRLRLDPILFSLDPSLATRLGRAAAFSLLAPAIGFVLNALLSRVTSRTKPGVFTEAMRCGCESLHLSDPSAATSRRSRTARTDFKPLKCSESGQRPSIQVRHQLQGATTDEWGSAPGLNPDAIENCGSVTVNNTRKCKDKLQGPARRRLWNGTALSHTETRS